MAKTLKDEMKFELLGLTLVTVSLICLASFFTSAVGEVGNFLKKAMRLVSGSGYYLLTLLLFGLGLAIMKHRSKMRITRGTWGLFILFLNSLVFFHRHIPLEDTFAEGLAGNGGGILGAAISYVLKFSFGTVGMYIILISSSIFALLLFTGIPLVEMPNYLYQKIKRRISTLFRRVVNFLYTEDNARNQGKNNDKKRNATNLPLPERPDKSNGNTENSSATDAVIYAQSDNQVQTPKSDEEVKNSIDAGNGSYLLPSPELLDRPPKGKEGTKSKEAAEKIKILEETLASFGIKARVTQVAVGPAITRYEIQPPAGVKVSRIVGLADDIALNMAAPGVRIEAPIPGKAAVGIEVPNREISTVYFRDIVESREFVSSPSRLTIALGKDIAGSPVVADLGYMPHLLIAGSTGSGKSVCINAIICSILFKATPDKVKLLLIDPKMVELIIYNDIPHLVTPVVTDAKKAAGALRWAVREMESRYELFAATGARDISRYNSLLEECQLGPEHKPLPYVVIVIDELADLMMVAPADVEDSICRLAQMARASGIHLVVATQRPSVDVITGLIKANIPSRISFAVTSQMDSRTILDMGGAEKLLGKGDMLFFPVGAAKPQRVQGAFLSDREVERVVDFLKEQARPVYDEKVLEESAEKEDARGPEQDEDELLPQAVRIFIETGTASISMLQRRLHIGYARAARLIDIMERRGIVGGFEGSKPRAVLMTMEQYERTFGNKNIQAN